MQAHDLHGTDVPPREVAAALTELAQLSARAVSSVGDMRSGSAHALLEWLIAQCGAHRGALVLMVGSQAGRERLSTIPALDEATCLLAARHMREDEVRAALASATPPHANGVTGAPSARAQCELVYELRLAESLPRPAALGPTAPLAQPETAVVMLCWDESPQGSARMARAQTLLPYLADSVSAVIASVLVAQRARELEALANQREALLREVDAIRADWEQTFDAVSDPVCVLTADYRLVRANATYASLFGREPGRYMGHACYTVAEGREAPCPGCPLPLTVQTQRPGFVRQERAVPTGPQGALETRVFETWTYPVVNADGTVDRVVEIMKDVTEQERLHELTSQADALREADRLKAELLGTVSHELRSPLAAIKGYAATLLRHERRLPREERHEFLLAIGDASDRLEVIIDRLLLMSQLETGTMSMHPTAVDLAQTVREAIQASDADASTRTPGRYTFSLRPAHADGTLDAEVPNVAGDPRLLRTVLDNLLENAVKYSPRGGEIEVVLRPANREYAEQARHAIGIQAEEGHPMGAAGEPSDGTGAMLEVRVHDTGMGIPSEHLGRIFDRFHRVDTRLTREVDGLGLGLAICRRIVELHRGMIWAESQPGEGSTFHVLLPIDETGARAARAEEE